MKKFKKILSATLGMALSIGGFATNLHAGNDIISTHLETYLQYKENLCQYMFLNNINSVNFFDLRYNLNVVPADERQLILGDSQKLVRSLSSIARNFRNSSQEEQNDMIKKFLKVYCISKGYNYRNILNVINSKTIVNSEIYPFQNASIESEILNQHGVEFCVEFAQELTEDEQTLFFEHGINPDPDENTIDFGI